MSKVGKVRDGKNNSNSNNNNSKNNEKSKQLSPHKLEEWLNELRDPYITACQKCGEPENCRRCATCHNRWYCSRECQREDWPDHRQTCRQLAQARAKCDFAERLGASYHRDDDEALADIATSLRDMPALPHLILGNLVLGSQVGQIYLKTWGIETREKTAMVPLRIAAQSRRGIEMNIDRLVQAIKRLLGRSLEEMVTGTHPVAVHRSCLVDKALVVSPAPTNPPSIFTI